MRKVVSLPENLQPVFHELTGKEGEEYLAVADPGGRRLGSGGGSAWALAEDMRRQGMTDPAQYLKSGKRIVLHGGGQGRRLPAYAPSGKLLTPIPVFRWSRGQRLDQTLLDLQEPLLETLLERSRPGQNTLIASGDVLILSPDLPLELPEVDVVLFAIWVDPQIASRHGAFFTPRQEPGQLDFMLQKADHATIEEWAGTHLFLMDIGIWVLSDRAVEVLMRKAGWRGAGFPQGVPEYYDLYGAFGPGLGRRPAVPDAEISALSARVVSLDQGEFYHYGTSEELIRSTEKIQNRVMDQRNIWHLRVKPHPSLFVQNAVNGVVFGQEHHHIWIENSHVPASWRLHHRHILTGIPENDWNLDLPPGVCLDVVPVGEKHWCLRPYGMDDKFRGRVGEEAASWMGQPLARWLEERGLTAEEAGWEAGTDIQAAPLFPLLEGGALPGEMVQWMVSGGKDPRMSAWWQQAERLSADQLNARANLGRLFRQRRVLLRGNVGALAGNYRHSVFLQCDLRQAAGLLAEGEPEARPPLAETEPPLVRIRDHMFRAEIRRRRGEDGGGEEAAAFRVLREMMVASVEHRAVPRTSLFSDQIVWGRSPARLDLAGGWSDTPPYCLQSGGSVLNLAVELNGQPPIQVYIRPTAEARITLRSIDNGVSEDITTFAQLMGFRQVGSAFSIPKAALCMAGFHPDFCGVRFGTLEEQLRALGGGFEISLLAAIPKGSGLGTSSILAATLLGTLSDGFGLGWDRQAICHRTLVLEQLLTTGGGWQDQYGGILPGIKLLESEPGTQEKMRVKWMPETLFVHPATRNNWLLYYTGITRVAKDILAEIVRGMFLNEGHRLRILDAIRQHAGAMAEAIQRSDFEGAGRMIDRSWQLNKALDGGTSTPEVEHIIDQIGDLSLGQKLLGAGGGGYLLICARDAEAAARIQARMAERPVNARARWVRMEISPAGFQTSRT